MRRPKKDVRVSVLRCPACGRIIRSHGKARTVACCRIEIGLRCLHCRRFAVALLPVADGRARGVCADCGVRYATAGAVAVIDGVVPDRPAPPCHPRTVRGGAGAGDENPSIEGAIRRLEDGP